MAETEQIERQVNPRTGEAIELRNNQWVSAGVATEDEIRKVMKDSLDEITLSREQIKMVTQDPDFIAARDEQTKAGLISAGKMLLRAAPALAIGAATGVGAAALGAGRLATIGMEATGQGVAEKLAQGMMGEESDPSAVAVAGAIPVGLRGLFGTPKAAIKGVAKRSKGGQARVAEHAGLEAQEYFARNQLIPDQAAVTAAYKAVGDANPRVFLPGLRDTAKALEGQNASLPKSFQDKKFIKQLVDLRTDLGKPTGVPFERINNMITYLNGKILTAEGDVLGALKKVRGAIWDDLENLANTQAAGAEREALGNAINTARRNFALKDMAEAFRVNFRRNDTSLHVFNAARFLDKLDDLKQDPGFVKGMGKELPAIEKHFDEVAKTLVKTSPQGTAIIFGAGGGAAGSALGESMMGSPGVGAAVGASAGVMLPDLFTKLALTEQGRRLTIKLLIKGNGRIAMPALITAANAVAAGARAKPGELKQMATDIQKNPDISIEQKIQMALQMEEY